jgi:hypothetical protein
LKVEARGNSVFISHNGLTVFLNRTREGYTIKATERLENGDWREAGFMRVESEDFKQFVKFAVELAK